MSKYTEQPWTTKVRIGRGYLWGSFLIAAAALKTPTRNGYNAQGVNLNLHMRAYIYNRSQFISIYGAFILRQDVYVRARAQRNPHTGAIVYICIYIYI